MRAHLGRFHLSALFGVLLSGCAAAPDPAVEFQKFAGRYAELRGVAVPASVQMEVYEGIQVQSAGDCIGSKVRLSPGYYELGDKQREMLMLHELGHCVEKLPHTIEELPDGCPADVMHYKTSSEECYEKHYAELIERFRKLDT